MAGIDFNAFFGNRNTGGLYSINFSDYNLIKNGSYGKLMKSYYAKQQGTSATAKADSSKADTSKTDAAKASKTSVYKKSTELAASTATTEMKDVADDLKKSAEALNSSDLWKTTSGTLNTDAIYKAAKAFADDYNDVLSQNEKVGTKSIKNQTQYMKNTSSTMSKALEKVGVTFDKDGRMSVDEDTLKSADKKDLRAAFAGSYSYASQVKTHAEAISSAASRSISTYGSDGNIANYMNYSFNQWT